MRVRERERERERERRRERRRELVEECRWLQLGVVGEQRGW